ncbi:hypothetical protein [Stutzerimonas urumqiensis]|uniref:hypothetical protein n=1 Tax=Stutzerimonas urumqiensis TaxID=638269 RepID=UPI0013CE742C|nr:hypothetical protein [Stutzerimonas urumqiensis]
MPKFAITLLISASVVVFAISLVLPAFETNVKYLIESWMHEPSKSYQGFEVLLLGWASIFVGNISWLANVGYFFSLVSVKKRSYLALLASFAALMFALLPLSHPIVEVGENGYYFYISNLNSGYYFWLSAISLVCAASLVHRARSLSRDSS